MSFTSTTRGDRPGRSEKYERKDSFEKKDDSSEKKASTALSREATVPGDKSLLETVFRTRQESKKAAHELVKAGVLPDMPEIGSDQGKDGDRTKDADKPGKGDRTKDADKPGKGDGTKDGTQDRNTLEKTARELHDAIHNGYYWRTSGRTDKIQRMLESLSESDRKALEKSYDEKYGNGRSNALRQDLKEKFREVDFRRAEAVLNRKDERTNDAGALMVALALAKEDRERGSAQVRSVLATLNTRQLAQLDEDFKNAYGKGYRDALMESKDLTQSTRDVLPILQKGIENRTAEDLVTMANTAVAARDKRLFSESVRGDSPEASEARKRLFADEKFKGDLAAAFPSSEARRKGRQSADLPWDKRVDQVMVDYLKEGRVSLATITRENSNDFTGLLDNPENIDLAVRNASDRERQDYSTGMKIATEGRTARTEEEKRAFAYYEKLKQAFDKAGNKREVASWEDQLLNGRETIVTEMARTHSSTWGHNTNDLMNKVENLSKADWELLKGPRGNDFRRQIEESLKTYASKEERDRIKTMLDEKLGKPTYEEAAKVRRNMDEAIKDNRESIFLGIGTTYDTKRVLKQLSNMTEADAARYKNDPEFRKRLDEFVDRRLDEAEQLYAKRLLKQIEDTGRPPREDAVDEFLKSSLNGAGGQESVRKAEKALEDKALRERLSKPDKDLSPDDRVLKRLIESSLRAAANEAGRGDLTNGPAFQKNLSALLETGKVPVESKMKMRFPRGEIIRDLVAMPDTERQSALSQLSSDERQIVEAASKNADGKLSLADRMRMFGKGIDGDYKDFKDELSKMSYEQRRALKSEYARKYGVNLENDFLKNVDEKDKSTYKQLLTPAEADARQRYYENYADMLKSSSGFSADGSKLTLDRANDLYATALQQYQKIYKTLPKEKQQALDQFFGEALQQYKDSKQRLAEVMVDAAITAATLAVPGAGAVRLAALLARAAARGAVARTAMMATIQGKDFEWTPENLAKQLATGAAHAATAVLTFNSFTGTARTAASSASRRLGRQMVENSALGAGQNVASDLVAGSFDKNGVNWEALKMSALMGAGLGAGMPLAARGLGKGKDFVSSRIRNNVDAPPAKLPGADAPPAKAPDSAAPRRLEDFVREARQQRVGAHAALDLPPNWPKNIADAKEPPVRDGYMRLYRGVKPHEGEFLPPLSDAEQKRFSEIGRKFMASHKDRSIKVTAEEADDYGRLAPRAGRGNKSYSDSRQKALEYAGKDGKLLYVDVPHREAMRMISPGAGLDVGMHLRVPHKYHVNAREHFDSPTNPNRRAPDASSDPRSGKAPDASSNQRSGKAPDASTNPRSGKESESPSHAEGRRLADRRLVGNSIPHYKKDDLAVSVKIGGDSVKLAHYSEIEIGRNHQKSVVDPRVSRNHARLGRDENGLYIKDTSANGTWVTRSGQSSRLKAGEKFYLKHGDDIRLGAGRDEGGTRLSINKLLNGESVEYLKTHRISRRLEDGFRDVGRYSEIGADGALRSTHKAIAVIDRENDAVLRRTIAEAKQRFGHLPPEKRARELVSWIKGLTERELQGKQLEDWVDKFNRLNRNREVKLGDHIKFGKGTCAQQSLLFKAITDQFDDMKVSLVRGRVKGLGHHVWNELELPGGRRVIVDVRNRSVGKTYDEMEKAGLKYEVGKSMDRSGRADSEHGAMPERKTLRIGDGAVAARLQQERLARETRFNELHKPRHSPVLNEGERARVESVLAKLREQSRKVSASTTIENGGDRIQKAVFDDIQQFLNARRARQKTWAEEGWEILQSGKKSAADHAKQDMILINRNTGKYYMLDATGRDKFDLRTPSIQREGVIDVKTHGDGLSDVSLSGKLQGEGQRLARLKVESMMRGNAGTPLDLLKHTPILERGRTAQETLEQFRKFRETLKGETDKKMREYYEVLGRTEYNLEVESLLERFSQKSAQVLGPSADQRRIHVEFTKFVNGLRHFSKEHAQASRLLNGFDSDPKVLRRILDGLMEQRARNAKITA